MANSSEDGEGSRCGKRQRSCSQSQNTFGNICEDEVEEESVQVEHFEEEEEQREEKEEEENEEEDQDQDQEDKASITEPNIGFRETSDLVGPSRKGPIFLTLNNPEALDCPICLKPLTIPVCQLRPCGWK
ncbi:hypothetical protein Patl1_21346 [Pistacia atlantica]|uniref:Uncharacterized protein n=1 Tax=Pistacia atlantica TaxID=434234 RepID=A0ACC1BL96_9ROSI|nr:hypothetical protein Patl1_21346 [Pistacia atlantica]